MVLLAMTGHDGERHRHSGLRWCVHTRGQLTDDEATCASSKQVMEGPWATTARVVGTAALKLS